MYNEPKDIAVILHRFGFEFVESWQPGCAGPCPFLYKDRVRKWPYDGERKAA